MDAEIYISVLLMLPHDTQNDAKQMLTKVRSWYTKEASKHHLDDGEHYKR